MIRRYEKIKLGKDLYRRKEVQKLEISGMVLGCLCIIWDYLLKHFTAVSEMSHEDFTEDRPEVGFPFDVAPIRAE